MWRNLPFILILLTISCNSVKNEITANDIFFKAEKEFIQYKTFKAIQYYDLCISPIKSIQDTTVFLVYCKLANCYYRLNDRNKLSSTFRIVDSLYKKFSFLTRFKFDYYLTYALYLHNQKNYENAATYFQKALDSLSSTDSFSSFLYYKLGACLEKQNNLEKAEIYYRKALSAAKYKKDHFSNELSDCYNAIAFLYLTKYSDYYDAKLYYDSVFYISKQCKNIDSISLAWNLFNIGYFYYYEGFYEKAEQYYFEAQDIYSKLKNFDYELAKLSYYQAYVYSHLEKFVAAHNKVDFSISYYLREIEPAMVQESYFAKAFIYFKAKDFKYAINYYNKALEVNERYHLPDIERILIGIGRCYSYLQMSDSAFNFIKRSIESLNKGKIKNINTYVNLYGEYARILINKEKYKDAFEIIESNINYLNKNLGKKNWQYGYLFYWKALALEQLNKLPASLTVYQDVINASVYSDFKSSIYNVDHYNASDIISYGNIINALIGKADVLAKMSCLPENKIRKIFLLEKSYEHYSKASEIVGMYNSRLDTESDRLQFTNSRSTVHELTLIAALRLFRATGQQKYLEKAFITADKSKATQLFFGLKDEHYKHIGGVPDNIITKDKNLQEEMVLLQSSIREEQKKEHPDTDHIEKLRIKLMNQSDESERLSKHEEKNYPEYARLKYSENILNVDTLKISIGKGKTMIEYAFAGDSLYTFILASGKIFLLSQPQKGIQDSVVAFRKMISQVNDSSYTPEGKKSYATKAFWLYKKLIKPAELYLTGKEIILIPDGILNLLPIETLVNSDTMNSLTDYSRFPYLLYNYSFSYSYAAGLLQLQQKIPATFTNKMLAFAPFYDNVRLDQNDIKYHADTVALGFLNSEDEVKSLVKIFGGHSLIGKKVTKTSFKKHASDGVVLHLSMHALVDNEYPMNSKLAFSKTGDSGYNGFMNTYEIYNLKLNSPLVVLNACNTGNGKLMKGEGVLSLSRGFIYAGCPSMVIALWNVSDYSGISLMRLFYRNLKKQMNVDISLQKAKIEYLKNADNIFSHPFYWAGFIQTGKTDSFVKNHSLKNSYRFFSIVAFFIAGFLVYRFRIRYKSAI